MGEGGGGERDEAGREGQAGQVDGLGQEGAGRGNPTTAAQTVTAMATALDRDADELSARLVIALAALAQALGREPAEADWWRLLDALLLIAAHPSGSVAERSETRDPLR